MTVSITRIDGAALQAVERELDDAGVPFPVAQRPALLVPGGYPDVSLFVARAPDGAPLAAAGVGIARSRALPGHRLYRLHRFSSPSAGTALALVTAVCEAARRDARCLRLDIELFDRDSAARAVVARILATLGLRRGTPRSYTHTLAIELGGSEDAVFAGLGSRARRGVRAPEKRGLVLRPVDDNALAPRLGALIDETFDRRDARPPAYPWPDIIELSRTNPSRSRLCGLFDPALTGAASLIGFAWGCRHGSYVAFEAGASSRAPEYRSVSLGYAPMWDLIRWARTSGADWFDLGGITPPGPDSAGDDPVEGISDFKRFFATTVVEVGEEWTLEPNPARARLARLVSAAARRFRI